MKKYDYIIIGSGFYGSICAERLKANGNSVLVLEKRQHIGGNCYSYNFEDTNINIHKYGTHIFHTNNKIIWDYINIFTEFNRYHHKVYTVHNNRVYSMPINLNTINSFYNLNLKPSEVHDFLSKKIPKNKYPKNLEEKAISLIGVELYNAFIKGYTQKQWGVDPKKLPASIITRLPVRESYFDSYFNDIYQGIPVDGYTPIFEKMLKSCDIELNIDYLNDKDYWQKKVKRQIIYTGPIDRYFEYCYGKLSWRSVKFELEKINVEDFQGTSVMNYADVEYPYTRIHEPKHLHREKKHKKDTTVIIREFSQVNDQEPYYPVASQEDILLYNRYKNLSNQEKHIIFGGRLGQYKYLDMDQIIGSALNTVKKILENKV